MKDLQEDNLFGSVRQRLGRYEETPSEELWEKIAATRKRRRVAAWPVLIGVLAVVGSGAALFLNSGEEEATKQVFVVNREQAVTEARQDRVSKPISITTHQSRIPNPELPITNHQSPITNYQSPILIVDSVSSPQPVAKSDSVGPITPVEIIPPFKKPKSKFQLYFSITPSLSFQKMIPTSNDAIIIQGLASRSPFSMKRFGFALDAGLQYDMNRFFGFYGGLSFYRQQQQLTYNYYDKDAQVSRVGDTWTFQIDRPQHSQTFDYTMTNFGARTGVLVTLKGEKLKHKFGAGIIYTHGFVRSSGPYNNNQSTYMAYQLFYRNEIRINEQFSWYVEPTFIYSFMSKEKLAEPFRLKPYRAGITGGVLYRFRN